MEFSSIVEVKYPFPCAPERLCLDHPHDEIAYESPFGELLQSQ